MYEEKNKRKSQGKQHGKTKNFEIRKNSRSNSETLNQSLGEYSKRFLTIFYVYVCIDDFFLFWIGKKQTHSRSDCNMWYLYFGVFFFLPDKIQCKLNIDNRNVPTC